MPNLTRRIRIALVALSTIIYFYRDVIHQTSPQFIVTLNEQESEIDLPPLQELVQSDSAVDTICPPGTAPLLDTITHNEKEDRKIPRVLHFTSKTRCATIELMNNINTWRTRMPSHSIYFHDDEAVERLMNHPLAQEAFPLLNETMKCVTGGATKSDLWRYLMLYFYGGIYSDIDNSPSKFDDNTISNSDDFFSVIEGLGIMSQFFLASSPGHPLMKTSLNAAINRLRTSTGSKNVMINNPAVSTGPGALKVGLIEFLGGTSGYIPAGKYTGIDGRNVTLLGSKERHREYIDRNGLGTGPKKQYYRAIGASHFFETYDLPHKGLVSCQEHLRRTEGTHKIANYTFNGVEYVDQD